LARLAEGATEYTQGERDREEDEEQQYHSLIHTPWEENLILLIIPVNPSSIMHRRTG